MSLLAALAALGVNPAIGLAEEGQHLTSSGPLTSIFIGKELGCNVLTSSDSIPSFFGGSEPGACGTFLVLTAGEDVVGEESKHVYGPTVPLGPTVDVKPEQELFNGKQEFIPTGSSQSLVTTVEVREPTTPETSVAVAELVELDQYTPGQPTYVTTISVVNKTAEKLTGTLYHAGDCVLSGSDGGYGVKEVPLPGSIACTATPNNSPSVRYMAFSSLPGSTSAHMEAARSMEGRYSAVWGFINKEALQFQNTAETTTSEDNGMGLSWHFEIPPESESGENLASAVMLTTIPPPAPVCPNGPPKVTIASDQSQIGYQLDEPGSVSIAATGQNLSSDPTASHVPISTSSLGTFTFTRSATDECGTTEASFTYTVLPPPALGKSVNVEPVSGTVLVALPAGAQASRLAASSSSATESLSKGLRFIPLSQARQIPVGSVLETTAGVAHITTATPKKGKFQEGDFGAGIFKLLQQRRQKGLTELDVVDNHKASRQYCATVGKKASAAAKHLSSKTLGRLTGSAHGKFTTRGRYSAATVRGTIWGVTDQCNGTLTKVTRGVVQVRDFVRRKTVTVRAGHQYLAHAPG